MVDLHFLFGSLWMCIMKVSRRDAESLVVTCTEMGIIPAASE